MKNNPRLGQRDYNLFGLIAIVTGVFGLVIIVLFLLVYGRPANEITSVLGAVAPVVGSIVTAYFGISAVSTSQKDASDKVLAAGLAADPDRIDRVTNLMQSLRYGTPSSSTEPTSPSTTPPAGPSSTP